MVQLESLEPRKMFDATPTFVLTNGALAVTGTDTAESIYIRLKPTNHKVMEIVFNGVALRTFTAIKVTSIQVNSLGGNDEIHLETLAIPGKLNGGLGNDLIYGSGAADRINGDAGDDTIYAGAGNDTVYGDSGRDKLFGQEGKDLLVGGAAKDVIRGGPDKDRITATIGVDDIRDNVGDIITNVP